MYSAERCRAQLAECRNLLPLAQGKAEATLLTTLIRSWKMIANQMDRYEVIMIENKRVISDEEEHPLGIVPLAVVLPKPLKK